MQDKTRKTIAEKRKVDTTLFYPAFDYKLKANDIISVNLISITKGEYDLSSIASQGNINSGPGQGQNNPGGGSGYVVNDSGYVFLPVLGKLKIAGMNLKEVEALIQNKVNALLDNTTANVRLLSFYVYFMGEIVKQGAVFAPRDRLTVLEAVALAGGFTEYANREYIKVIRNQNNTAHIYYIDLLDQNIITKQQVYLLPNDILVVEPYRVKGFRQNILPNLSVIVSVISVTLTLALTFTRLF